MLNVSKTIPGLALAALGLLALAPACNDRQIEPNPPQGMTWPNNDHYAGVGAGRLVVTNNFSDTLSIIDMNSFEMVLDLPVGLNPVDLEGPHHVAASRDGEYYYMGLSESVGVTGSGPHGAHGAGVVPGYALRFRASDNALLGRVRIDRNPGDVVVTGDGKWVLVSHFDLRRVADVLQAAAGANPPVDPAEIYKQSRSAVAILDAEKMDLDGNGLLALVFACPAAHGIRLSPDQRYAYMSCLSSDELAVIDLQHPDLLTPDPSAAVKLHYVGSDNAMPNPDPAYEAPVYGPYSVSVDPVTGVVWVSCQTFMGTGELRAYDPALGHMDLSRTIELQGSAFFGSFKKDGSRLYMTTQAPDAVVEIDTSKAGVQGQNPIVNTQPLCAYTCDGQCVRQTQVGVVPTCSDATVTAQPQCFKAHVIEVMPDQQHGALVCEGNWPTQTGTTLLIGFDPLAVKKTLVVDKYPDGVAIVKGP
jgi:DNA-binding beta-propeller fold protein YncE